MTTTQSPYATPPSVLAQITALPDLPMADIKSIWKNLFKADTPTHNRQFLERRIAYRLQEVEFRKVDAHLLELIDQAVEFFHARVVFFFEFVVHILRPGHFQPLADVIGVYAFVAVAAFYQVAFGITLAQLKQ